jgi:FAD/FMN-containing dehydrogenase
MDSPRIGPDDPRYCAVVDKRFNKRFSAQPEYVRLARSTDEMVAAVGDAVREGRRLVVTSGGHCLEGSGIHHDLQGRVELERTSTSPCSCDSCRTNGTMINHPDTDVADRRLNSSGVPWHTLHYQANYPRLQRIKARRDPRDVFRHALSIRPGSGEHR